MKLDARRWLAAALLAAVLASACASQAARQRDEAAARAARLGHPEIEYREKLSPRLALGLGFLPFGAGGFYVGERRLGASGLLWPFSMAWVPKMAYDAAIAANDRDFELRMMQVLESRDVDE